jgi:regulatory protein
VTDGAAPPDQRGAIEQAALRLLAGREHSRHELRRKLGRRHADADLVDAVLSDLEARRLLSDHRFVEAYVDQRRRKGFGPLRIRAELSERGVAGGLVDACLGDDTADWQSLMASVAARKFGHGPIPDRRELGRRARFLEQRGFPAAMVMRYLDRAGSD